MQTPLITFLLSYLMNMKTGPGELQVHNDQTQVKRFDNGFMHNGIYDLNNAVRFRLWTRENPYYAQEIVVWNRKSLFSSKFDKRRLTKIFLHGANHRSNEVSLDKETAFLRDAYITFADVNFILMDWTRLAMHLGYLTNNGDIAAKRLAQFLIFLSNHGTPLDSVHIIGHSWGSHVAGAAGRMLNGRVGRITGIDPAGPFYTKPFNRNPKRRLNKTNAKFVDVIHVDGGGFLSRRESHLGIIEPIGHVDFYPNGGSRQPSCPPKLRRTAKDFYCSHERGIYYFAESIGSPFAFPSCKCEDWKRFTRDLCECGNDVSFMGEHSPKTRTGLYFLNVQKQEPYGLGPQTQVILRSITRAPTFVNTETQFPQKIIARKGGATNSTQIIFNIPTYSTRYAKMYRNDVINALFSTLSNFTRTIHTRRKQ